MRIGIDIDDTIIDTYTTIVPMIGIKYKVDINDIYDKRLEYKDFINTYKDYDKFTRENYHNLVSIAPLKKNVVNVLRKLKDEGNEIIFITSRNFDEYEDPYQTTINYFIKNSVPYDKIIVNVHDKGLECLSEKIDVFIDDSNRHCLRANECGIKAYRFNNIFSKPIDGVDTVSSWNEIYDILKK